MDWGLGAGRAGRAGSPCPTRCPHCPARILSLSLGPFSAPLCPLSWYIWRLLPRSSRSRQAGLAGPAGSPSPGSHPTGPDFPALPHCAVSSTPGHFDCAPARCARLWVCDILPVFPRSDASSPAPGKPGCSSSSSPSTWSSGDLAPLRRQVSHRRNSLVSAPWQSPCCQQDFGIELAWASGKGLGTPPGFPAAQRAPCGFPTITDALHGFFPRKGRRGPSLVPDA